MLLPTRCPELDQRIVQRTHRTGAQRLFTVDLVRPGPQRGKGGHEARCRPGEPRLQLQGPRLQPAVSADDRRRVLGTGVPVDVDAEHVEARQHRFGVVAVGQIAQRRAAVGQGRADQGAVGNALRPRDCHHRVEGGGQRFDAMRGH